MTRHLSPDERWEQILGAARQCFLQKGYFATKMDDIAREAGLSKGGVYFHFASKQEVFRALVQQEYEAATAMMDEVAGAHQDMLWALLGLGEHFVGQFASHTEQSRFMAVVAEMALRDEAIASMLRELQQSYIRRIVELLERGVAGGQIRCQDATSTAILLKAMLDGIQAAIAIGYQPDLERLVLAAVELLSRALMVDPPSPPPQV